MHMRDDILYIPIECKELTLLIYNTTDDQFYDIYVLVSPSYWFREVYFFNTQIYFAGYSFG